MSKSNIEWTEDTWNPIVGCSILSPGCKHCYAMPMAARIEAMNAEARISGKSGTAPQYDGTTHKVNGHTVWTGKLAMAGDNILLQPLKRKKPTTYFVNSMGDLFHEDVPDEWIRKVFGVMARCPQHTFQILTKRAARMCEAVQRMVDHPMDGTIIAPGQVPDAPIGLKPIGIEGVHMYGPLPNVWLGVSTERQQEADERIPDLLKTPAAVRFISAEPLLGPIELDALRIEGVHSPFDALSHGTSFSQRPEGGRFYHSSGHPTLDWVIVGGESGPGSRPMHPDWARSLRDQCSAAGVPFFFKQWGEWFPCAGDEQRAHPKALRSNPDNHEAAWPDGTVGNGHHRKNGGMGYPLLRVGKKRAGRSLDGMIHDEYPEAVR